jgi:hypothetical protein
MVCLSSMKINHTCKCLNCLKPVDESQMVCSLLCGEMVLEAISKATEWYNEVKLSQKLSTVTKHSKVVY